MTFNQWFSRNKRELLAILILSEPAMMVVKYAMGEAWKAGRLDTYQEILREEEKDFRKGDN